ncbi:hypothetical protein ALC57_00831 [Trachymyrmex cornetzi]|uniref:Uncharacterized protein n=1 Tax=Trachymyrmex cornetzi TaxID=471704 RepID=A0A195ENU1_9HYME|nr:hypothetical protein ALC57_00831 [Trachymyrmex cornetzi]
MDINLLATSPCSSLSLSLFLFLSCTIYPSPVSLFLTLSVSLSLSLSPPSLSLLLSHPSPVLHTLAEGSTRSSNTRVHNRARPYASVREIHTYTRVSHERREPTVQPHLAYRGGGGGEEEEAKEGEGEAGGWPRRHQTPSAVHRAAPASPIPRGSSERMFCHHTTLHATPNSPSNRPGLLAPSDCERSTERFVTRALSPPPMLFVVFLAFSLSYRFTLNRPTSTTVFHLPEVTFHHAAARVSLAKISPFNTFEIFRLQFHFDRYEKCTLPSDTLLKRYFTTSTMLRRITETAAGARGRSQDFIGNLFAPQCSSAVVVTTGRDDDYEKMRSQSDIQTQSLHLRGKKKKMKEENNRTGKKQNKIKRDEERVSEAAEGAATYPDNSVQFGHGDLLRPLHGIGHLLLMLQCHAIIIASSSHSIVRSHGTRAKQKVKDSPLAPGTEALARLSHSTSSRFPSATVMGCPKIIAKYFMGR